MGEFSCEFAAFEDGAAFGVGVGDVGGVVLGAGVELGDMQGLGGEGELHAHAVGEADDIEHESVFLAELDGPVGALEEHVDEDVEGVGAEVVEPDVVVVLAGVGVELDDLADAGAEGFDFFGWGVVGDVDHGFEAAVFAAAVVVDFGADEGRVGDGDE